MIPGAAFFQGVVKPVAITNVHSAVRLGGLFLGLATVMMLPWPALPVAVFMLGFALRLTAMVVSEQFRILKPWWPMAAIVLTVHTVTGCVAAGQLVISGFYSGLVTLGRIMLCLGLLSFFLRVTSLDETIDAVHFWFRPLQKIGIQTRHLGLVLAVALGTAPVVLEEGKRIRAVVRMRRAMAEATRPRTRISRWRDSLMEWGHLVLPVMESLGRRSDTLSLSLATRMPADESGSSAESRPSFGSLFVLILWLMALIWFAALPVMKGLR